MILISRVTLREILLPLAEPFRTATGVAENRRIALLEIDGDGGTVWTECVAGAVPEYSRESVDGAWDILAGSIIPALLARQLEDPAAVHTELKKEFSRWPMARAAIEMGSWALAANEQGKSLASLLAGFSSVTSEPKSSIPAGIVIGLTTDADDLIRRTQNAVADGYQRIKLKISPGSDIASIRSVSAIAGKSLAVDANGSFSIRDKTHLRMLEELDELGLSMIEQPFGARAMKAHAKLQKMLDTPICLDESISDVSSVEAMINLGSGRIVNLKPGRVGGFTEAIAIHDRCASEGIPVWCGGMLETGVGRAYNVALASLQGFTLPGDLSPSRRYWQRDVITSPWTMSPDGFLEVPLGRSGTGVEVDTAFIEELTVSMLSIMA